MGVLHFLVGATLSSSVARVEAWRTEHRLHLVFRRPNNPAAERGGPGKRVAMAEPKTELEELTERMKIAVGTDSGLGKSLKFNLKGDGFVYIDGGSVTNEDKPADLTLTITMKDLIALGEGKLDPMTAVMTGSLGLSDMAVAMGLQGKMQALFSKLR
jgi:putative sterol carrier protein